MAAGKSSKKRKEHGILSKSCIGSIFHICLPVISRSTGLQGDSVVVLVVGGKCINRTQS
jgi:hypothetical protein